MEEVQAVIRQRSLLKRLFGHFKCSKAELSFSIGLGSFIACGVAHFVEGSKFVPSSFPTEWALPLIALSIAPIFWIACVFMFNKGWIDLDYDGPLPAQTSSDDFWRKEEYTSANQSFGEIDWPATHLLRSDRDSGFIVFK